LRARRNRLPHIPLASSSTPTAFRARPQLVRRHLSIECALATFKSKDKATEAEVRNAIRKIERADYIFAGPGSPTYAIRNWAGTPIIETVARRVDEGGHLVLASAAAIAISHYSVPVYEIYKVGADPHWVEGLNLLAPYGLDLTSCPTEQR
jgi:cyanophycinase-like exopeptidase